LLMVGMQDQMSRAWNNANRRTETGREARAALRMMATDLAALKTRRPTSGPVMQSVAAAVTSAPIPFYFYAPAGRRVSPPSLLIPNYQTNTGIIFGLVTRANGDLNLVGYYVARRSTTNLNGLVQSNFHLFRYRRDITNTISNFSSYFNLTDKTNATAASTLFSGIDPTRDEILAYNVAGFSILAMGQGVNSNGLNFTLPEEPNQGSRFHITLHLLPEEIAQRLGPNDWGTSNTLAKFARSYEFRLKPIARPAE
jgi:hypothetical protein